MSMIYIKELTFHKFFLLNYYSKHIICHCHTQGLNQSGTHRVPIMCSGLYLELQIQQRLGQRVPSAFTKLQSRNRR